MPDQLATEDDLHHLFTAAPPPPMSLDPARVVAGGRRTVRRRRTTALATGASAVLAVAGLGAGLQHGPTTTNATSASSPSTASSSSPTSAAAATADASSSWPTSVAVRDGAQSRDVELSGNPDAPTITETRGGRRAPAAPVTGAGGPDGVRTYRGLDATIVAVPYRDASEQFVRVAGSRMETTLALDGRRWSLAWVPRGAGPDAVRHIYRKVAGSWVDTRGDTPVTATIPGGAAWYFPQGKDLIVLDGDGLALIGPVNTPTMGMQGGTPQEHRGIGVLPGGAHDPVLGGGPAGTTASAVPLGPWTLLVWSAPRTAQQFLNLSVQWTARDGSTWRMDPSGRTSRVAEHGPTRPTR